MSEQQYFASRSKDEYERQRLSLLESVTDPKTIYRLEAIGVRESWNCLEVGAGTGSIAVWLANRVGHTGRVVATDINTRFLQDLSIQNLEVRTHDITKDDLEEDRYDLAHCRALLAHLSDPEKALEQMSRALKRGGWIFVEEPDYGLFEAIDPHYPSASTFNKLMRTGLDAMEKRRAMNPYFGRRVRSLVEKLGFLEVDHDALVHVCRGGETWARMQAMTVQTSAPPMIAAGLFTQEEFDAAMQLFQDPEFYFLGDLGFKAWGKRP
jgi:ubiquinone/menaquinone biosynthesis C-methylase UbiE